MKRIAIVFGTRPEAIKMAPVVKEFAQVSEWETKVVVTGQHREMLDQVLDLFQIQPDCDLRVMSPNQSLTAITARVLQGMTAFFGSWRPDWVLVHGDTTTAFATALAAFYDHIPVGHVEAGLRTDTLDNPFPEEANRRLVDTISSLHFAPTENAAANLRQERVKSTSIFVTGNTVIDALHTVVDQKYSFATAEVKDLDFTKKVILATVHRRENWGEPLRNICEAIVQLATELPVQVVFAMHKNPKIQKVVKDALGNIPQVRLIDAPGYLEFANLMNRSYLVLTDSGGLQEEAPALGKPVLVLRETTERPEGLAAGTLKLVGTKKEDIVESVTNLVSNVDSYSKMAQAVNPYGDGRAAYRIRKILEETIKQRGDRDGNKT